MEKKPKKLWKSVYYEEHQDHVTISTIDSTTESDERIVYMDDLEKRKQVYGICGECNEPGTGEAWCQPCNSKRFKDNFKNWTSGNKDIDEFIQHSQLNALSFRKCLEWVPFEKFQNITYVAEGGFDFLNEIKTHLNIHLNDVIESITICKGQRPKISEDVPKLLADLIIRCWDAEIENRPTTKELYQILKKWRDETYDSDDSDDGDDGEDSEDSEYDEDSEDSEDSEEDDEDDEDDKDVNSSDLSSFQFNSDTNYTIQSTLANPISECLDVQLSELELNEICQDSENNIE
ncbi:unnamed protein product [Rhizophagus irregularis]|nr:unnamed protein product [Rhizophagus irregularis]